LVCWVVVVVVEVIGAGFTTVVCSVVVVLVTGSGLLQPATKAVPANIVTAVRIRLLVMA